jgi:hypothetical protein
MVLETGRLHSNAYDVHQSKKGLRRRRRRRNRRRKRPKQDNNSYKTINQRCSWKK